MWNSSVAEKSSNTGGLFDLVYDASAYFAKENKGRLVSNIFFDRHGLVISSVTQHNAPLTLNAPLVRADQHGVTRS